MTPHKIPRCHIAKELIRPTGLFYSAVKYDKIVQQLYKPLFPAQRNQVFVQTQRIFFDLSAYRYGNLIFGIGIFFPGKIILFWCEGLLYVVLAAIIKVVGVHKVMHFLPPVVTGPIIILIGLNLAPSAVSNASTCWWLALVSIAVIVVANIWGKGMVKIIPILLGVVISYVVALIAGMVDFSGLDVQGLFGGITPLLGFQPFFTDFGGSIAKFDISAILVMAPIAIASMMEHIGDMSAISATVGENFIEDPGLHRTLIGDGIATSLSAMFGGPANTTYGENTGVLVLSRVHDPKVIRLAAL